MSDTLIEDKINNCSYALKLKKQGNNLFQIKVDAEKQGIKYSLIRPMKMEFLSDYLFYVNGDFQAAPVENKYSLYGSLFIKKSFLIRTQPQGEILFFLKKDSSHPLISIGEKIVYTRYKDLKSTIKLGYGESKDNIDRMFVLINKGELSEELPGKYLKKWYKEYYYKFYAKRKECPTCEHYINCAGTIKSGKKEFSLKKEIVDNLDELQKIREKMKTWEGRNKYNKRFWLGEHGFGIIKGKRKFEQFLVRGRDKVKQQWTMICIAFNLRKIWSLNEC